MSSLCKAGACMLPDRTTLRVRTPPGFSPVALPDATELRGSCSCTFLDLSEAEGPAFVIPAGSAMKLSGLSVRLASLGLSLTQATPLDSFSLEPAVRAEQPSGRLLIENAVLLLPCTELDALTATVLRGGVTPTVQVFGDVVAVVGRLVTSAGVELWRVRFTCTRPSSGSDGESAGSGASSELMALPDDADSSGRVDDDAEAEAEAEASASEQEQGQREEGSQQEQQQQQQPRTGVWARAAIENGEQLYDAVDALFDTPVPTTPEEEAEAGAGGAAKVTDVVVTLTSQHTVLDPELWAAAPRRLRGNVHVQGPSSVEGASLDLAAIPGAFLLLDASSDEEDVAASAGDVNNGGGSAASQAAAMAAAVTRTLSFEDLTLFNLPYPRQMLALPDFFAGLVHSLGRSSSYSPPAPQPVGQYLVMLQRCVLVLPEDEVRWWAEPFKREQDARAARAARGEDYGAPYGTPVSVSIPSLLPEGSADLPIPFAGTGAYTTLGGQAPANSSNALADGEPAVRIVHLKLGSRDAYMADVVITTPLGYKAWAESQGVPLPPTLLAPAASVERRRLSATAADSVMPAAAAASAAADGDDASTKESAIVSVGRALTQAGEADGEPRLAPEAAVWPPSLLFDDPVEVLMEAERVAFVNVRSPLNFETHALAANAAANTSSSSSSTSTAPGGANATLTSAGSGTEAVTGRPHRLVLVDEDVHITCAGYLGSTSEADFLRGDTADDASTSRSSAGAGQRRRRLLQQSGSGSRVKLVSTAAEYLERTRRGQEVTGIVYQEGTTLVSGMPAPMAEAGRLPVYSPRFTRGSAVLSPGASLHLSYVTLANLALSPGSSARCEQDILFDGMALPLWHWAFDRTVVLHNIHTDGDDGSGSVTRQGTNAKTTSAARQGSHDVSWGSGRGDDDDDGDDDDSVVLEPEEPLVLRNTVLVVPQEELRLLARLMRAVLKRRRISSRRLGGGGSRSSSGGSLLGLKGDDAVAGASAAAVPHHSHRQRGNERLAAPRRLLSGGRLSGRRSLASSSDDAALAAAAAVDVAPQQGPEGEVGYTVETLVLAQMLLDFASRSQLSAPSLARLADMEAVVERGLSFEVFRHWGWRGEAITIVARRPEDVSPELVTPYPADMVGAGALGAANIACLDRALRMLAGSAYEGETTSGGSGADKPGGDEAAPGTGDGVLINDGNGTKRTVAPARRKPARKGGKKGGCNTAAVVGAVVGAVAVTATIAGVALFYWYRKHRCSLASGTGSRDSSSGGHATVSSDHTHDKKAAAAAVEGGLGKPMVGLSVAGAPTVAVGVPVLDVPPTVGAAAGAKDDIEARHLYNSDGLSDGAVAGSRSSCSSSSC